MNILTIQTCFESKLSVTFLSESVLLIESKTEYRQKKIDMNPAKTTRHKFQKLHK